MIFFFFFPPYVIFVANLFFPHFVDAESEKQRRSLRQLQTQRRGALRPIPSPQQLQGARSHVLRGRLLQFRTRFVGSPPQRNKQALRSVSLRSAEQEPEVRAPWSTRALSAEDWDLYADLEGHCIVLGEIACRSQHYCDFVQSGCVRVSPAQFERIREELQSADPSSPESPS